MRLCDRSRQIYDLHNLGVKTKVIAERVGLTPGYVCNIIKRLKFIEQYYDLKTDRWIEKENKILAEHYMDWLLFLSQDQK